MADEREMREEGERERREKPPIQKQQHLLRSRATEGAGHMGSREELGVVGLGGSGRRGEELGRAEGGRYHFR